MMSDASDNSNPPILRFEIRKRINITPTESSHELVFRNYYRCPNDETTWKDDWSCMCNDRCPICGTEVEPYDSEDI